MGGGIILVVRNWKFRGGRAYVKICAGGMDIFWNYTMYSSNTSQNGVPVVSFLLNLELKIRNLLIALFD